MSNACVNLPGPEQSRVHHQRRAVFHQLDAAQRLHRANQDETLAAPFTRTFNIPVRSVTEINIGRAGLFRWMNARAVGREKVCRPRRFPPNTLRSRQSFRRISPDQLRPHKFAGASIGSRRKNVARMIRLLTLSAGSRPQNRLKARKPLETWCLIVNWDLTSHSTGFPFRNAGINFALLISSKAASPNPRNGGRSVRSLRSCKVPVASTFNSNSAEPSTSTGALSTGRIMKTVKPGVPPRMVAGR